jgi:dihydrofolate reductase
MTRVICDMSMSLDGYVTGRNDSRENPFGDGAEMLHDWIFDAATDEDRAVLQDMRDSVGAIVMGRTSFDKNEGDGGWDDGGPLGDIPCFVVTHHAPESSHPSIYTFLTIFLDDLDAQMAAIADRGLEHDELEAYPNGVRKAVYRDADGNELGFAGAPPGTTQ